VFIRVLATTVISTVVIIIFWKNCYSPIHNPFNCPAIKAVLKLEKDLSSVVPTSPRSSCEANEPAQFYRK